MPFSSAVQWWEEWQLRLLVLGSLCVQCFLAFFAAARKLHIRAAYRLIIWLSYLGADALAVYALATLFNRQRKVRYSSANGAHDLEVLWAPILLMHLGGQVNISAYDIEDNDLWKRHMLTAVSQVVVAVYVFCKSWSSSADKRLLAAAILLFILGIFKCLEKPLALKRASFKSLVSSSHPASRTETTTVREVQLEEYIQRARDFVQEPPTQDLDRQAPHLDQLSRPDKLFVDLAHSYPERLTSFKSFWLLPDEAAYEALRHGLSKIFDLLYTKDPILRSTYRDVHLVDLLCSAFTWWFSILLPIAAIGLLHSCHKKTYKVTDITVTFVLLYVTFFLDFYSIGHLRLFQWHDKVAQHSVLGFFARNKRHTWLMGITGCLQCKELLNQYWSMKPSNSSKHITSLVRDHVKYGWLNYILDAESYWRFSDIRGHLTLQRMECEQVLLWSLDKPFDESILLWHVATEFCFHLKGTQPDHPERSMLPRQVSNYMMHLLFNNSDMLMPGSRMNLFTTAYKELERIVHSDDPQLRDEGKLVQKIVDHMGSREGFIHDSWVLAQGLMQLDDEEKMWKVITGVWVEMLCFSASRCRGYLHAKGLGSGGEYLSFVWLLMAHAGLETFPERQQRVQLRLPKEERVRIAKQRIQEAARNQAAGVSIELEVVETKLQVYQLSSRLSNGT